MFNSVSDVNCSGSSCWSVLLVVATTDTGIAGTFAEGLLLLAVTPSGSER